MKKILPLLVIFALILCTFSLADFEVCEDSDEVCHNNGETCTGDPDLRECEEQYWLVFDTLVEVVDLDLDDDLISFYFPELDDAYDDDDYDPEGSVNLKFKEVGELEITISESSNTLKIVNLDPWPADIHYGKDALCLGFWSVEDCVGAFWRFGEVEIELTDLDEDTNQISFIEHESSQSVEDVDYTDGQISLAELDDGSKIKFTVIESINRIQVDFILPEVDEMEYGAGDTCTGYEDIIECEGAVWEMDGHAFELTDMDTNNNEVSFEDISEDDAIHDEDYTNGLASFIDREPDIFKVRCICKSLNSIDIINVRCNDRRCGVHEDYLVIVMV